MPNSEPAWVDGEDCATLVFPPCSIHVWKDLESIGYLASTDPATVFLAENGEPVNVPVLLEATDLEAAKLEAITVLRRAVNACVDAAGKIYRPHAIVI